MGSRAQAPSGTNRWCGIDKGMLTGFHTVLQNFHLWSEAEKQRVLGASTGVSEGAVRVCGGPFLIPSIFQSKKAR